MKPTDNNLIFDRLVDDELSADERNQLLKSLDVRPDGWRQCALAFLEHQSWRRQMKSLVAAPPAEIVVPTQADSPRSSSHRGWSALALAACLMVAFLAGRMIAPEATPVDPQQQIAMTGTDEVVEPGPAPVPPGLHDRDVVTLLVRDDQGQAKRVRVPLVDLTADRQSNELADAFPEDIRQRFKRQGKDLRVRRRFAPLYFEQGEQVVPMAVPVDDAYIVPVGGPVL